MASINRFDTQDSVGHDGEKSQHSGHDDFGCGAKTKHALAKFTGDKNEIKGKTIW